MAVDESDESEERFLFDEDALERCLAEGSNHDHEAVDNCAPGCLLVTKSIKENFIGAFPDEKDIIEDKFTLLKKKEQDSVLAAFHSDRLENQFDTSNADVQRKIYLIASADRAGATIVTGEYISSTATVSAIAAALGVSCMNVAEFVERFGP